jgi:hypothetical protein
MVTPAAAPSGPGAGVRRHAAYPALARRWRVRRASPTATLRLLLRCGPAGPSIVLRSLGSTRFCISSKKASDLTLPDFVRCHRVAALSCFASGPVRTADAPLLLRCGPATTSCSGVRRHAAHPCPGVRHNVAHPVAIPSQARNVHEPLKRPTTDSNDAADNFHRIGIPLRPPAGSRTRDIERLNLMLRYELHDRLNRLGFRHSPRIDENVRPLEQRTQNSVSVSSRLLTFHRK